jgi:lyso-ornithine lipid O-acyltransferase
MIRLVAALRLAGFLGLTLPLMPVQYLFLKTSARLARSFPHHYHKAVARMLGFEVIIEGAAPQQGPILLVSNHVSWIDIVALSATAPLSFIAKREVAGWPLFGQLAKLQRTVFVDRDRRHKTGEHRNEISSRLEEKDTLVLFPEGTSFDGLRVLNFKSAFFGAVEATDVPVVPVAIAYSHVTGLPMTRRQRPSFAWYGDMDLPRHLWAALKATPIRITIRFHEPLTLASAGGRKQLAQATEAIIRDSLAHMLSGR